MLSSRAYLGLFLMPALRLFGIHWAWASDDFACLGTLTIAVRAAFLVVLATAWGSFRGTTLAGCMREPFFSVPWPWWDSESGCPILLLRNVLWILIVVQCAEVMLELLGIAVSLRCARLRCASHLELGRFRRGCRRSLFPPRRHRLLSSRHLPF